MCHDKLDMNLLLDMKPSAIPRTYRGMSYGPCQSEVLSPWYEIITLVCPILICIGIEVILLGHSFHTVASIKLTLVTSTGELSLC